LEQTYHGVRLGFDDAETHAFSGRPLVSRPRNELLEAGERCGRWRDEAGDVGVGHRLKERQRVTGPQLSQESMRRRELG
jgi:hypothetical protein